MKMNSGTPTKSPARPFHPYEKTLSQDALLAELDDRQFEWGDYQDIEEMLHGKPYDVLITY